MSLSQAWQWLIKLAKYVIELNSQHIASRTVRSIKLNTLNRLSQPVGCLDRTKWDKGP